jgi:hypothetical protein
MNFRAGIILPATTSLMTIVDGRIVFRSDAFPEADVGIAKE